MLQKFIHQLRIVKYHLKLENSGFQTGLFSDYWEDIAAGWKLPVKLLPGQKQYSPVALHLCRLQSRGPPPRCRTRLSGPRSLRRGQGGPSGWWQVWPLVVVDLNYYPASITVSQSVRSDSPRAARMPADQNTSPHSAGRNNRPPIREP